MNQVNSVTLGSAAGSLAKLQRPAAFPSGMSCARIILDTSVPVKNTTGGSKTLTFADALAIMQSVFAQWTMSFGDKAPETVDDARPFDDMRQLNIAATGHDMLFNGKELRNYSSSDADAVVIASGATVNVSTEFIRPFIYERFAGGKITEWCPGAMQMRQVSLQVQKGGTFPTGTSQDGSADITVIWDTLTADTEAWANVFRLHVNEQSGLDQAGPMFGGALLALWEATAAGTGSLTLGLISLLREGDTALHEQVTATRVARQSTFHVPQGSYDLNNLVTMLWQPEESVDTSGLPTSSAFLLRQHSNNLAPMKSRWLYAPTVTPAYRDQVVGPNLTPKNGEVKLVSRPALDGDDVGGHTAAVSSLAVVKPSHPKFQLVPGRRFADGQAPTTHIPSSFTNTLKTIAQGESTETAAARIAQETKSASKYVPGVRSPMRGATTDEMVAVGEHLSPSEAVTVLMRKNLNTTTA